MKRIIGTLLAMTTLLLSSCGGATITKKRVCNSYVILEDLRVKCDLFEDNKSLIWEGVIDKWLIDIKTSSHYWYEYSNGEHALKVGVSK